MDFTLIPICSEIEHHLEYDKILRIKCEFCGKEGISYRCINCEYGLCNTCYMDKMAEEEDRKANSRRVAAPVKKPTQNKRPQGKGKSGRY